MGVQEEKEHLSNEMSVLRERLANADIKNADETEINQLLDSITDVYIQIKQFVQKFDRRQWDNWGPGPWSHLERGRAALESKLSRLQRTDAQKQKRRDHMISLATVVFMAISAIAAAVSAYFGYQASQSTSAGIQIESIKPPNQPLQPTKKIGG